MEAFPSDTPYIFSQTICYSCTSILKSIFASTVSNPLEMTSSKYPRSSCTSLSVIDTSLEKSYLFVSRAPHCVVFVSCSSPIKRMLSNNVVLLTGKMNGPGRIDLTPITSTRGMGTPRPEVVNFGSWKHVVMSRSQWLRPLTLWTVFLLYSARQTKTCPFD